jgi:hypothetical protein
MMQPTYFRNFPHKSNFWRLDLARDRCVHIQRPVRAPAMIVSKVLSQLSPQMALVQDDHVIQAFAANTPDEPFDVRILPRTPGGDDHFFDPHLSHPLPKRGAIDAVPIA